MPETSKVQQDQQDECIFKWKASVLPLGRRILNIQDIDDIEKALTTYAGAAEFLKIKYPQWNRIVLMDWCLAIALSDQWLSSNTTTRLNNSMLVSALLITVTSQFMLSPSSYGFDDMSEESAVAFVSISFACTCLYLISIVAGVIFVDNALSRAYCKSDQFILIIRFYTVRSISQTSAYIGVHLFPIACAISLIKVLSDSSYALLGIVIIGGVIWVTSILTTIYLVKSASNLQKLRIDMFNEIVDEDGQLKPQYYPPTAPSIKEYRDMFSDSMSHEHVYKQKKKDAHQSVNESSADHIIHAG